MKVIISDSILTFIFTASFRTQVALMVHIELTELKTSKNSGFYMENVEISA